MIDLIAHFTLSLLIGFIFWFIFDRKSSRVLVLCEAFALLSGFLVDLDHIFDYVMTYGFTWNFQHFLSETYFQISGKNYVLFHGYEYVIILGIAAFFCSKLKRLLLLVLATSLFFHLLIDIIIAHADPLSYSLIYRILISFRAT